MIERCTYTTMATLVVCMVILFSVLRFFGSRGFSTSLIKNGRWAEKGLAPKTAAASETVLIFKSDVLNVVEN